MYKGPGAARDRDHASGSRMTAMASDLRVCWVMNICATTMATIRTDYCEDPQLHSPVAFHAAYVMLTFAACKVTEEAVRDSAVPLPEGETPQTHGLQLGRFRTWALKYAPSTKN